MITIERVEKKYSVCSGCQKKDEEVNVYHVSITQVFEDSSQSSSFRLCTDCLDELASKIKGLNKNTL